MRNTLRYVKYVSKMEHLMLECQILFLSSFQEAEKIQAKLPQNSFQVLSSWSDGIEYQSVLLVGSHATVSSLRYHGRVMNVHPFYAKGTQDEFTIYVASPDEEQALEAKAYLNRFLSFMKGISAEEVVGKWTSNKTQHGTNLFLGLCDSSKNVTRLVPYLVSSLRSQPLFEKSKIGYGFKSKDRVSAFQPSRHRYSVSQGVSHDETVAVQKTSAFKKKKVKVTSEDGWVSHTYE